MDTLYREGLVVFDARLQRYRRIRVVLLMAAGDRPVLSMFNDAHGHTALFCCDRCCFVGMHASAIPGAKTRAGGVYFLGYSERAAQGDGVVLEYGTDAGGSLTAFRSLSGATAVFALDAQQGTEHLLEACARHGYELKARGVAVKRITTPMLGGFGVFFRPAPAGGCTRGGRPLYAVPQPLISLLSSTLIPMCVNACVHAFVVVFSFVSFLPQLPLLRVRHFQDFLDACAAQKSDGHASQVRNSRCRACKNRVARAVDRPSRGHHPFLPRGEVLLQHDNGRAWRSAGHPGSLPFPQSVECVFAICVLRSLTRIPFCVVAGADDSDPFYRILVLLSRAYNIIFVSSRPRAAGEINEAHDCMVSAAKLGQENMPYSFCTHNLHIIVTHFRQAEVATGSTAASNELWGERGVRAVVAPARNRSTGHTSPFLWNEALFAARVSSLRDTTGMSIELLDPVKKRGSGTRDVVSSNGDYFSSTGYAVVGWDTSSVRDELEAYFEKYENLLEGEDFSAALAAGQVTVLEFHTAVKNGLEAHSVAYTLVRKRCSHHVAIEFLISNRPDEKYGRIERFYLVFVRRAVFRLAFVSVFKTVHKPTKTRPFATVDPTDCNRRDVEDRVVDLANISRVVVVCKLEERHGTAGAVAAAPEQRAAVLPYSRN